MSCLEFANPENVDALLRYSPKDLVSLCPDDITETANNDPIRNKLAYMKEVHSYLKELKRNNYQLPREYNYSKKAKEAKDGATQQFLQEKEVCYVNEVSMKTW